METLPIFKVSELDTQRGEDVFKIGRTTGPTTGHLKRTGTSLTFKMDKAKEFMIFKQCYSVEGNGESFFQKGDSGSGVFVITNDGTLKPLGIAFAFSMSETAVCKIETIVDKLDLVIIKSPNMAEVFSKFKKKRKEEEMNWSSTGSTGNKRKREEMMNTRSESSKRKKIKL